MIIEDHAPGVPSWVDLMSSDQDSAIEFYSALFDWNIVKSGPDMGGYAMCFKEDQPVAGIGQVPEGNDIPCFWNTYINVVDTDATTEKVLAAGGQVFVPAMTVAGDDQTPGRMAILVDPTGAVFGVWQAIEHLGAGLVNEPGSLTWNELLSSDPQVSRNFLTAVFGYGWERMSGSGDMEYYTASVNGRPIAGVMGLPPGVPAEVRSYWNAYFAVADTPATVARVRELGGAVLHDTFESPFGPMAVLADRQGAAFSVVNLSS